MIENFDKFKKIHFIGIGGIGISAVAQMFLKEAKEVSGSDVAESMVTDSLRALGAKISIGASAENISKDTDLVVYTIAIDDKNPEIIEAKLKNSKGDKSSGLPQYLSKEIYSSVQTIINS